MVSDTEGGRVLEQWHYDPAADLDQKQMERLQHCPRLLAMLGFSVRSLAAVVVRCWFRVYHGLMIEGLQNLPADRSFVIIANHASHLDTLCLLSALPIRRVHRAF